MLKSDSTAISRNAVNPLLVATNIPTNIRVNSTGHDIFSRFKSLIAIVKFLGAIAGDGGDRLLQGNRAAECDRLLFPQFPPSNGFPHNCGSIPADRN